MATTLPRSEIEGSGLRLLNVLREGAQDDVRTRDVSAPGQAEPGEFYVTFEGVDFAVRVEPI